MKRDVIHFSLRCSSDRSLPELAERVGAVLGARLGLFEVSQEPGVTHGLLPYSDDARFLMSPTGEPVEIALQDISAAVADTLTVLGAGDWRPTTR